MNTEHAGEITVASASKIEATTTINSKEQASSAEEAQLSSTRRWGWSDAAYLLAFAVLVIAMAYRYTPHITGEVAGEWWDPLLNMWTLSWNTTTLLHDPLHLWQAQILYPNSLTLSYSENLLGETLFFAPIFLLSHNPVLAYNVVFYLTLLLCAVNMYILARHYTASSLAAFVAGLIYAFSPYRIGQIDHIHIIAGAWMPLALLYLDRSLAQNRWRNWSLFALFYLLQLLSSIYYGIFFSYMLLAYVIVRYARPCIAQWRQQKRAYIVTLLRNAVKPLVVFGVMLVILALLMTPYLLSLGHGLGRSLDQSATFSAYIRDFLFTAPFNWLYGVSTYNGVTLPYDSEHYLFLGWITLAIAACGAILTLRRRIPAMRAYLWTGLIILLFAFGPFLQFSTASGAPLIPGPHTPVSIDAPGWPMPWFLAYYLLPGFRGLRVPARLIGVLLIVLALLAAYAVAWLEKQARSQGYSLAHSRTHSQERSQVHSQSDVNSQVSAPRRFSLPASWRRLAIWCALVCLPLLVIAEGIPAYLPVTHVPTGDQIPAVYQWLATHEGNQPIVELPMAHLDENFTSKDEAWYDYYAIYHPHPIMNGWSGYRPPLTVYIAGRLLDFPSSASLNILRQYRVHYVVLHLQLYPPQEAAALLARVKASRDLQLVAAFGSDSVWKVK